MAKKTAPKKTQPKKRRQICSTKGCRKYRLPDGALCRVCAAQATQPEEQPEAVSKGNGSREEEKQRTFSESLMRVTDLELANLGRLDAEIKNLANEQKILDHEQYRADVDYDNLKHQRSVKKEMYANRQKKKERELTAHLQTIAQRYDLDADQMSVDERSGIIRDLRPDAAKTETSEHAAPIAENVGPN